MPEPFPPVGRRLPRPTRRGAVVLVVVAVATALALTSDRRSLDVVVFAGGALLLAGLVAVLWAPAPSATRSAPAYGTVGEAVPVELQVDGDRDAVVTVRDALPAEVTGDAVFETVADGRPLAYEATLRQRGVHDLGPARVAVHDVFGCWDRSVDVGETTTLVAVPRPRSLYGGSGLLSGYASVADDRGEFASLRQYRRGDALRDVNWKASAKRPEDLVVTEYGSDSTGETVVVGVDAPSSPDEAAEAAASVAVHLLDVGLTVGLVTPAGRVSPARGDGQRRELLAALARFGTGRLPPPDREAADVLVTATAGHVELTADGTVSRFEDLVAEPGEVVA